ncbi:MAG: flippase-like domain-containing protein [Sporocytophaga sp.]|uniref:lysylphosphatidylglycerol synthase transmembrane domain-containing protein n=1 Tax=Sporocytophaga sp. TaxID=2231183 RepID=UPI001AFCFFE6|nr:lysylphosphatidylglycerol synthase transmembrane domain-containing protein [Sporocytophaga sp.]MBO9698989.1 flippase-like domain-containing protein [Sporocytophaga sp.]
MSSLTKNILKYSITLILSVLLMWYALRDQNILLVWEKIKGAKLSWVLTGLALNLISHLSRARRWNLLMEPLGYKPKLYRTFIGLMIGYFANLVIPRMGEVTRCAVLNRTDNVPVDKAFGTVVAERIFDFICLLILISLSLILEFDRFSSFLSEKILNKETPTAEASLTSSPLFFASILLVICVSGFILFRNKIKKLSIYQKGFDFVTNFLKGILEGFMSVRKLSRRKEFVFHTLFIWVCYYFMTYLVFFSMDATSLLSPIAGLVILVVGGLGMSAPVQGGIGAFHKLVTAALEGFYNVDKEDGMAFSFVIHGSQTMTIVIVGGLCLFASFLIMRKVKTNDLR